MILSVKKQPGNLNVTVAINVCVMLRDELVKRSYTHQAIHNTLAEQ